MKIIIQELLINYYIMDLKMVIPLLNFIQDAMILKKLWLLLKIIMVIDLEDLPHKIGEPIFTKKKMMKLLSFQLIKIKLMMLSKIKMPFVVIIILDLISFDTKSEFMIIFWLKKKWLNYCSTEDFELTNKNQNLEVRYIEVYFD